MVGLTLVVPDKTDSERDSVAASWAAHGGHVLRLGRFWEPPPLEPNLVKLYGNDAFCLVIAQLLGLQLVSPPDDLLLRAPSTLVKRQVALATLASAGEALPAFIKPLTPKQFRAGSFANLPALAAETRGLPTDTPVIVSEIVDLLAEARTFVLDSAVRDCAIYAGSASASEAEAFASVAARDLDLPATCVLDVGFVPDRGWVLIEGNPAWGAGLNGCQAERVLPCIAEATRPRDQPDA